MNVFMMLPFYMSVYGMTYDGWALSDVPSGQSGHQNLLGLHPLYPILPLTSSKMAIVIA
jgi:hypothetical protein